MLLLSYYGFIQYFYIYEWEKNVIKWNIENNND